MKDGLALAKHGSTWSVSTLHAFLPYVTVHDPGKAADVEDAVFHEVKNVFRIEVKVATVYVLPRNSCVADCAYTVGHPSLFMSCSGRRLRLSSVGDAKLGRNGFGFEKRVGKRREGGG